ncbi:MAG: hypothetical protein LBQ16_00080 [Gracilibacteraceae bacterium]|jgi:hypothetical protein|nr:hypothetical protein [Gracilibacteraceae bacterium]
MNLKHIAVKMIFWSALLAGAFSLAACADNGDIAYETKIYGDEHHIIIEVKFFEDSVLISNIKGAEAECSQSEGTGVSGTADGGLLVVDLDSRKGFAGPVEVFIRNVRAPDMRTGGERVILRRAAITIPAESLEKCQAYEVVAGPAPGEIQDASLSIKGLVHIGPYSAVVSGTGREEIKLEATPLELVSPAGVIIALDSSGGIAANGITGDESYRDRAWYWRTGIDPADVVAIIVNGARYQLEKTEYAPVRLLTMLLFRPRHCERSTRSTTARSGEGSATCRTNRERWKKLISADQTDATMLEGSNPVQSQFLIMQYKAIAASSLRSSQ